MANGMNIGASPMNGAVNEETCGICRSFLESQNLLVSVFVRYGKRFGSCPGLEKSYQVTPNYSAFHVQAYHVPSSHQTKMFTQRIHPDRLALRVAD